MPAKPLWFQRLDEIVAAVDGLAELWIDRSRIEALLQVGPRRAQQILRMCGSETVGSSSVIARTQFAAFLRRIASGDEFRYENRRQERFARLFRQWQKDRQKTPQVLVAAPLEIQGQRIASLPEGVELGPGFLTIRFSGSQQALEKLLALAMAMGRDLEEFEKATATT